MDSARGADSARRADSAGREDSAKSEDSDSSTASAKGGDLHMASWFEWTLENSRLFMTIPVAVLLLAALGAFAYGVALFVNAIDQIARHPFPIGKNITYFVVLIDVFLVGCTSLIVAMGFYELFVSRQSAESRPFLPTWLVVRDLHDLKIRIVSMIVLVSATSFIDPVVDFHGGLDVLYLGAGIALIIVALTIFVWLGSRDHS
jgi:uncharacterized membrane protein YqhA